MSHSEQASAGQICQTGIFLFPKDRNSTGYVVCRLRKHPCTQVKQIQIVFLYRTITYHRKKINTRSDYKLVRLQTISLVSFFPNGIFCSETDLQQQYLFVGGYASTSRKSPNIDGICVCRILNSEPWIKPVFLTENLSKIVSQSERSLQNLIKKNKKNFFGFVLKQSKINNYKNTKSLVPRALNLFNFFGKTNWNLVIRQECVKKIIISPNNSVLCAIYHSGRISVFSVPSMILKNSWSLEEQVSCELVKAKDLCQMRWWNKPDRIFDARPLSYHPLGKIQYSKTIKWQRFAAILQRHQLGDHGEPELDERIRKDLPVEWLPDQRCRLVERKCSYNGPWHRTVVPELECRFHKPHGSTSTVAESLRWPLCSSKKRVYSLGRKYHMCVPSFWFDSSRLNWKCACNLLSQSLSNDFDGQSEPENDTTAMDNDCDDETWYSYLKTSVQAKAYNLSGIERFKLPEKKPR